MRAALLGLGVRVRRPWLLTRFATDVGRLGRCIDSLVLQSMEATQQAASHVCAVGKCIFEVLSWSQLRLMLCSTEAHDGFDAAPSADRLRNAVEFAHGDRRGTGWRPSTTRAGPSPSRVRRQPLQIRQPGMADPTLSRIKSSTDQPLFADGELPDLRRRWGNVQTGFVDDPQECVPTPTTGITVETSSNHSPLVHLPAREPARV